MFHTFPNHEDGKNRLNNGQKTLVRSIDFDYYAGENERPTEFNYLTSISQKGYIGLACRAIISGWIYTMKASMAF